MLDKESAMMNRVRPGRELSEGNNILAASQAAAYSCADESYSATEHIAQAVLLNAWSGSNWVMLSAYFDESRTDKGHPFPVVSGFLSSIEAWKMFERRWEKFLHEQGIHDGFHMVDFIAGKEKFVDWKGDYCRKERLLHGLIAIIEKHVDLLITMSADSAAYEKFYAQLRNSSRGLLSSPYALCGFVACGLLDEWAISRGIKDPIVVTFDAGNNHRHDFEKGYALFWKQKKSTCLRRTVAFASDVEVTPLQSADLLAWTVARTLNDAAQKKSQLPLVKRAFDLLMGMTPSIDHVITKEKFEQWRAAIATGGSLK